jgi:hypothetical protein
MAEFQEIELSDGTVLEFPMGMADDAIRTAVQGYMAQQPALASQPQERGFGAALFDNIVGRDDGVQSYGEQLGTLIRGATAGTARGLADVPALPANIAQLGALGVEKALGMDGPSMVSRGLSSLPDTRKMLSSVPVIGPESEFQAPGRTGKFVSTAGEFAGGAGGMNKVLGLLNPARAASTASDMVRYGLAPGIASEGAGQLTEGTAMEPYARAAAAIGTSLVAAPRPGAFRGGDEASRMANVLEGQGVRNVTAGQARASEGLMRAEGRLAPSTAQLDDFTASVMRQLGSTEKLATPEMLRAVEKRIVDQMDSAVSGVSVSPNASQATRAMQIGTDYAERVPVGTLTPRVRGIANELRTLAVARNSVPLSRLKTWRSDIGKLTTSNDAATREAAHGLRELIDEMTDSALQSAGRADDIASLASARESYRNFIGVRDASTRAGAERGTLSPTALNQSIIRSQGRESYALGRGTSMQDFTRAGAATLRPAPTVSPGSTRNFALPGGLAAVGGTAGFAGGGVPGAIAGAGLAQMAPPAGQALMRSNAMQTLLRDPAAIPRQSFPMLPGLLSQDRN